MDLLTFRFSMLVWCYLFNARETSGIRSPDHNARVGGVPHSAHLAGLAADVVYLDTPALEDRQEWARRLDLRLIVRADHDHLQPEDWQAG